MIITRSPLRISLGGGGTDLPSYYNKYKGFIISASINKYVYIGLHKTFEPGLFLKYSSYERVKKPENIRHPIIKESIKILDKKLFNNLELVSLADIPARTGLGSSGSFTTALLLALHTYQKKNINEKNLAELACSIEIEKLKEPIGKQDQYIASYGGIKKMEINKKGNVKVKNLKINKKNIILLQNRLLLFFTGYLRKSSKILSNQKKRTLKNEKKMIENLHYIKRLGLMSANALEKNNLDDYAHIMNEHWIKKVERDKYMSNSKINKIYDIAISNGDAIGGKLIGAGGGGFFMFYTKKKNKLIKLLSKYGMKHVDFSIEFQGSQILTSDDS